MKKYCLRLVTFIFLIGSIASCKKEANTTVIPPPVGVNQPPVARAGADTTFTLSSCGASILYLLDGTKSSDPENKITYASWSFISGSKNVSIIYSPGQLTANSEIRRAGVYNFELQIVNNHNLTSKDTVTITVIGSSPKEYELDITSNTTYLFRDNYEDCDAVPITAPCDYYDETEIHGTGTFAPIGLLNIGLIEHLDTATLSYGGVSVFQIHDASNTFRLSGSTLINFKKLIQQGGGAFSGSFTIESGSAEYCDANIYKSLAPLLATGNLDTTTKKISIRIKGKTFF